MTLRDRQVAREAAARQLAMGKRAKMIAEGHMGAVLKRWINADVVPIASLLRSVARAYLVPDMGEVARLLDTPAAELSLDRERPLKPLMFWLLEGRSPGRGDLRETTYADDLALTFMATLVTRLSQDRCTLSAALALTADALRDTVQGQFISSIQGASAMQAIREREPLRWRQRKSLNRICAKLYSQVRPQLLLADQREEGDNGDPGRSTGDEPRGGRPRGRVHPGAGGVDGGADVSALEGGAARLSVRSKKVLYVLDARGEERRLELRPPSVLDWEVMSLCWRDERDGGTHPYRSLWLGLAGMFYAAAQQTGGWFEVASQRVGRKHHTRTTNYLVLSERAAEAIRRDVERWTSLGFSPQPMIVPPEDGDYLTVKHRKVTGQRPPLGLITDASNSSAWSQGASLLAASPWRVNHHALDLLDSLTEPWDTREVLRIAEHKRLAADIFYLPTCMDFRGRIYYRTPWVTPQSDDLGKSLLQFPSRDVPMDTGQWADWMLALVTHFSNLYGHGVDKLGMDRRVEWWDQWQRDEIALDPPAKPLTFAAHRALMEATDTDSIPVQLDGSCNGLQHLSALLRDEVGSRHVNLSASNLTAPPADIYERVAEAVCDVFDAECILGNSSVRDPKEWTGRFRAAGVRIDRKLTKGPVMVLPYGGTIDAVRRAVKAAVLEQLLSVSPALDHQSPWHSHHEDGYGAFAERDLKDHPLFNSDCHRLADVVWSCITPAIPRAMAFMKALQEIGSWIGERGLSWRTGGLALGASDVDSSSSGSGRTGAGDAGNGGLWVVQAKSKAARKQVTMRGFHLPDVVRRLSLMANANEVDPRAHRTGIVANFIHSLDAAHLASSIGRFKALGGSCVGSVHDCLLVRPSEAGLMGKVLRDTFVEMYEADPLAQPVKLLPGDGTEQPYESWYALAEAAGVELPTRGSFDINEVRESAWFFS